MSNSINKILELMSRANEFDYRINEVGKILLEHLSNVKPTTISIIYIIQGNTYELAAFQGGDEGVLNLKNI